MPTISCSKFHAYSRCVLVCCKLLSDFIDYNISKLQFVKCFLVGDLAFSLMENILGWPPAGRCHSLLGVNKVILVNESRNGSASIANYVLIIWN